MENLSDITAVDILVCGIYIQGATLLFYPISIAI